MLNQEDGKPSAIELHEEDIYDFIINKTEIKSEKYMQMLNNTISLLKFPNTIIIREKRLPPMKIPKELHIKYNKTVVINGTVVSLPIFTSLPGGRLGNQMGEYATLFALGKLYNVTVYLHPSLKANLIMIFPHLSMKDLPNEINTSNYTVLNVDSSRFTNYAPLEIAASGLFGPSQGFIINSFPFEIRLFNGVREDILKEFRFNDIIIKQAQKYISSIQSKAEDILGEVSFTYIGLHVRKTDYKGFMQWSQGILPGYYFVRNALKYYREKFRNALFIAASDDLNYMKTTLGHGNDVFFADGTSAELDMAILSSCNHSIITVGTFGFMASYLTGGEVLYPDSRTKEMKWFIPSFFEEANLTNYVNIKF